MHNNIRTETQNREIFQIQANSEDEYWSKKYEVSTEDLKGKGMNIGISDKILKAISKNKVLEL
ncbi:hypothetical protein [Mucilaginibacter xinganensis]|uniref:Uncharacterized protein n=1 Tax=Mucilaginibacter xinganensis TaxID=1234841 RepID=A0A223NVJ5_9SPHI|nr:hypothetical protein [Mucilaginibacter xinganensis]ASU33893.1 hypothetical protein MuYL_2001 [Mucilaginibacter xinganensis]